MDTSNEEYLTLAEASQAREKVKGSTFLAFAIPVEDSEDADHQLCIWRKQYHDSTHIGWARRLAPPPDGEIRWDDDGEPRGTTGLPILKAITRADLWGVLIGVVRWYGGTKLGTGGLARAYGGVAEAALTCAETKLVIVRQTLSVFVPNDLIGIVYSLADKTDARIEPPVYMNEGVRIALSLRKSMISYLVDQLREQTAGQALIEVEE